MTVHHRGLFTIANSVWSHFSLIHSVSSVLSHYGSIGTVGSDLRHYGLTRTDVIIAPSTLKVSLCLETQKIRLQLNRGRFGSFSLNLAT